MSRPLTPAAPDHAGGRLSLMAAACPPSRAIIEALLGPVPDYRPPDPYRRWLADLRAVRTSRGPRPAPRSNTRR